jgi:type IV secretion system protein VirB3
MTLRLTPIHRALHGPNLILGGECEPVLITAIICAGVAVSALNLVAIGVGGLVWLVATFVLRMMAKADPYMSKVYLRQRRTSRTPGRERRFPKERHSFAGTD